ncbi:TldD/PmbA family protein [Clostridium sp. 'deep sea']|uniref:TldD/PmbA family protein n=1 Tax=Clostridium sp. 'deep sea' TaxID=2779445 RepID=UPI0018966FE6|nr:TldD/PmbA family protein [Clostridium sp. 'deep sea']QOR35544.1 TldD/PmbA family protein [Clostridium sp. 'deep sea']
MDDKQLLEYCINYLSQKQVAESQVFLKTHTRYELISEMSEICLLKSNYSNILDITVIKDHKKASIITNKLTNELINKDLDKVILMAESSQQDLDYRVSPKQKNKAFSKGVKEPDFENMLAVLQKFIVDIRNYYPKISLKNATVTFNQYNSKYLNSNDTYFESYKAYYSFIIDFIAKDEDKISNFSYTSASFLELPEDILNFGNIKFQIENTIKQLNPQTVEGKFEGDVIITPDCIEDFVYMLVDIGLKGSVIYSKASMMLEKLNKPVANEKFSLYSNPLASEISEGFFITDDGYCAKDLTIIKNGVLKSFLLDDYSAKKANMLRSGNNGSCYIVESGNTHLTDMIKNVKKGLYITSLSHGRPALNGDFSGVAKNSFYIENGTLKNAVNETMIFANIYEMLNNISEISIENVNFGKHIYPWITFKHIIISGK